MPDFELSNYQKDILDYFVKNPHNNILINAYAGCVDCDTEFLSQKGWKKISEYKKGDKVLQYNKNGIANFKEPELYHKYKADYLYHFETKYGVNQSLSEEHKVIYINDGGNGRLDSISFSEMKKRHENCKVGFTGRFINTFLYDGPGIDLTDEEIKLMCAVICDGSFYNNTKEHNDSYMRCRFHLKKQRKKDKIEEILNSCNIDWWKSESADEGYTDYYTNVPRREKVFSSYWYNCSLHQLQIICDNIMFWSGNENITKNGKVRKRFSTTIKETADFIQFAYTATGHKTTISINDRRGRVRTVNNKEYITNSIDYNVVVSSKATTTGLMRRTDLGKDKVEINKYKTKDGYKYCFTTETGMWVMRRGNCICVTGNSGKSSTLRLLTEHTKTSDVYLAFNNSVAEEFKQKITNPKTKVYTIHALSYLIMNTNLSENNKKGGFGKKPGSNESAKLDNLKPYKILDSIYQSEFGKISFEYKQFLSSNFVSLYNLVRVTMTDFDNIDEINKLVSDHNLFVDLSENNFKAPDKSTIYSVINRLDKKSKAQFESDKIIDFTDMIYITYWKLKEKEWTVPYWLLFTNIYLDECLPGYIHVPCLIFEEHLLVEKYYTLENLWKMQEREEQLPLILSYNEFKKVLEYRKIKKVEKKRIAKTWGIRINKTYEFENSKGTITKKEYQDIRSTSNHLFLTEDGWKYMKDLKVGDKVLIADNKNIKGYSYSEIIKTFPGKVERVYDIEVEENHTFVAKSDPHDNGFIVHNCQDQNNLQLNMIKFIKREGGRYIAVGDENQSCYNFNGSNAYSFNIIPQMFAPMKEFDLPICYRCPKSHLKKVNDQFGIPILPRDNAPEGKIKTINKNQIIKYIQPGDMIVSRKNKWLSDIIPELVSNGFSVYMEDKEMVAAIKKMIDSKKFRTVTALENNLIKSCENFLNKGHKNTKGNLSTKDIKTEFEKNNKENSIKNNLNAEIEETNSAQVDNILFLLTICKYYTKNYNPNNNLLTFGKFVDKILCTEPNDEAIRVTSVHKAKGLEADNVFVLNEGKVCYIPMNSKEQNIQEKNLSYISITRAKENLYLVREESK